MHLTMADQKLVVAMILPHRNRPASPGVVPMRGFRATRAAADHRRDRGDAGTLLLACR
jgi:hypothetical protein